MKPPSHQAELQRLNRIIGQLEGIKQMIEDQRYCPEILIQLKAARAALLSAEKTILMRHFKSCVTSVMQEPDEQRRKHIMAELIKLYSP